MAKINLKFLCNSNDGSTIECEISKGVKAMNRPDEILITIIDTDSENEVHEIYLDKSTAIKFAKTLRTEINKIVD